MEAVETEIPDIRVLRPRRFGDSRGFFSETYTQSKWDAAGLPFRFVQDNHSLSAAKGVIRGLHFQTAPFAQDKLVRVLHGRILDVAVDLRRSSKTFGKHVAVELSFDNWRQLLVPIGFAHGFCTLEPNTDVFYKVTNFYSPQNDRGLAFDDPDLGIDWPFPASEIRANARDRSWPRLRDLVDAFE